MRFFVYGRIDVFVLQMILNYYEKGKKTDPTVIFIHGSASDATVWLKEVNIAAANGYHCIALDLRGHGETKDKIQPQAHVKLDFDTHLHDIKDTLRSLELIPPSLTELKRNPDSAKDNYEKLTIVTHSFGGILAVHMAKQYPEIVTKLVLACMPPKLIFPVKNFMSFMLGKPLEVIQNNLDFFAKIPIRKRYKSSITTNAHVLKEIFKHVKNWNCFKQVDQIKARVHLAAGRFDFVATAGDIRRLHQRIENSTFELFKWSCHAIMEDEPEHFEKWLLWALAS